MKRKKQEKKQIFWPRGFWAGDICAVDTGEQMWEVVIVVSANPSDVPPGQVPVEYACKKKQGKKPFFCVPALSLAIFRPTLKTYPPSQRRRIKWAMFYAGDPVAHNHRNARVIAIEPHKVPLGCVPLLYEDDPKVIHCEPADSLYRR